MTIDNKILVECITDSIGYGDKMYNITKDICERALYDVLDGVELDEAVSQALDDGFIYTQDQWDVMAFYQSPENANFGAAYEEFYNTIHEIVDKYVKQVRG